MRYEVINTATGDTNYIVDSSILGAAIREEGAVEISGLTSLGYTINGDTATVRYSDGEGEYELVITPAE